ncbi:MAG: sensor histidine kinase [Clostridiales bacterium]|nr:sensor histidine kinase [Clostridiales bacterium]
MNNLIDRLLLLLFCSTILLTNHVGEYSSVYILVAVTLAAIDFYLESERASLILFILSIIGSLFLSEAFFFLPLITYGLFEGRYRWLSVLSAVPFIIHLTNYPVWIVAMPTLFLLSAYLSIATSTAEKRIRDNNALRDLNAEKQLALEKANQELMERKDFEVHSATLEERNRIAREMHDSIGHVLTSALLQTGALITTCTDESMKAPLTDLKNSLSDGMNQVRSSIHDLYEESEDLYTSVQTIIRNFSFCPVKLLYNLDTVPDRPIRNTFIAVIKESLSNIARHSDATEAIVSLREHPALYQLSVRDNGSVIGSSVGDLEKSRGMGLLGIEKRVENLKGNVVFRKQGGFEVFLSVPKEQA